jgi:hypothetical protein
MQKQPLRVWLYARTADARPGVLEEQLNSLYREAERRGYTVVNGGAEHRCAGDLDRPALFAMCAAGGWTPLCSPGFPGSATTGWRSI